MSQRCINHLMCKSKYWCRSVVSQANCYWCCWIWSHSNVDWWGTLEACTLEMWIHSRVDASQQFLQSDTRYMIAAAAHMQASADMHALVVDADYLHLSAVNFSWNVARTKQCEKSASSTCVAIAVNCDVYRFEQKLKTAPAKDSLCNCSK